MAPPGKVRVGRPLIGICEVLTSLHFPEFRTNWTERKHEKWLLPFTRFRNKIIDDLHRIMWCYEQQRKFQVFSGFTYSLSSALAYFFSINHHNLSVMELGHLLTRSGLTCPEVSSKVCHDSFLISSFRHVLYVVCNLLRCSPAYGV
jgi:hypothetical protein